MFVGIIYALIAGMMWGLVFVSPLLLPEYPPVLQSVGRYLAFGLIALPLAWLDRRRLSQLSRADWKEALKLAAVGNLLYYLCLASAIQRAGGPLPTMIIGTLPVVIAITANRRNVQRDGKLPAGGLQARPSGGDVVLQLARQRGHAAAHGIGQAPLHPHQLAHQLLVQRRKGAGHGRAQPPPAGVSTPAPREPQRPRPPRPPGGGGGSGSGRRPAGSRRWWSGCPNS